jgi:XTP/dITP diphosphohydrolase
MPIVVATENRNKLEEIGRLLSGWGIELLSLAAFTELELPPEDGIDFNENAEIKARAVYEATGLPTVADDSGLVVDALGGAPGVHSKRYSAEATATYNNAKLLRALSGEMARTCRFVCSLAVVAGSGTQFLEGRCEGRIALSPRGEGGFGYDPLFVPDDFPDRTMAELEMEEKNRISHRGKAFSQLPALLESMGILNRA